MTANFICIHGHFYQPPRENPWLEEIETQESAAPYHDWNERITDECYLPNSGSRILNPEGKIAEIVNNYAKISFNFGPTLLSWLKEKHPRLLKALLDADQQSQQQFNGHGNALAQAYNHMILPLANSRDKYTQIYWGIKHFEHHFGRPPEGLWLSETAVDLEVLDIMSELGVKFTILAPNQAKQSKSLEDDNWQPGLISTGTVYQQKLPSGRSINLFFYDGNVAKAVAFEKLLTHGEVFADRLLNSFPNAVTECNLMHIATDGESYGHHHPHGDMGLAYALRMIEEREDVKLVNYGYFLELQEAKFEVEIHEDSSWSCAHGIERWRSNCGCRAGQDWTQEWRGPLREALDWLRDQLIPKFEEQVSQWLKDPWQARNDYIHILNDRSAVSDFLKRHAQRKLSSKEKVSVLKWLELQRHAMLMYTSCGWFFDELSGIETLQVVRYAARVIQLAKELLTEDYEEEFIERLAAIPSNLPEFGNGKNLYLRFVKPLVIDLFNVSAHLTATLPFISYENKVKLYCYEIDLLKSRYSEAGKIKLFSGLMDVRSEITHEQRQVWYAVLYQGDQNLICTIQHPNESLTAVEDELFEQFGKGDIFELVKLFESHFGPKTISLRDLFFDMKLQITRQILSTMISELENRYHEFIDNNAAILYFVSQLNIPLPKALTAAISYVINQDIINSLDIEEINLERLQTLFENVGRLNVKLDDNIRFKVDQLFKKYAFEIEKTPHNEELIQHVLELLRNVKNLPLKLNFWNLENVVMERLRNQEEPYELLKDLGSELDLEV
ncbi:DUF3536 domain-containing protein [Legionella jordanis]|uniref:Alpha-amylase 1 n=1 Tax=Legionella jordanis TaxID=456 RepID=A0A0W0VAF8_9GAMM|nr:DUF3536 domain-containing protein [Legionella jordanis]KTD17123.1 Alpha-amylase 1 [Legionella jordanis]RMX03253.1 DUF3536 domain-containing protein [Legionella jordanis]VEH12680.1 Alpha-amylase 1 [Legionella jordanis]HAT8713171.1 DUF3536 domain-containing protein [Legionella jordanis]